MKIYFEDGKLVSTNRLPIVKVDFTVDATYGVSGTINILDELKQRETEDGENLVVYTNSIFAFNNRYAWNEKLKVPEIYIRAGQHMVFKRIDELTARELREGHNLAKMYVSGEFEECVKEGDFNMKYAIRVEETIGRTIIVEAENLIKAIEMVEDAANNDKILLDGIEDFVGREVKPSDVFEGGIVPDGRDVSFYEHLRVTK